MLNFIFQHGLVGDEIIITVFCDEGSENYQDPVADAVVEGFCPGTCVCSVTVEQALNGEIRGFFKTLSAEEEKRLREGTETALRVLKEDLGADPSLTGCANQTFRKTARRARTSLRSRLTHNRHSPRSRANHATMLTY